MKGGDGMPNDMTHEEIMAKLAREKENILAEMKRSRGESDAMNDLFAKRIAEIA